MQSALNKREEHTGLNKTNKKKKDCMQQINNYKPQIMTKLRLQPEHVY